MKKAIKVLIVVMLIITIVFFALMFYCLDRSRTSKEFNRYVADKNCIWEAQEIDCVLYAKETLFYKDIKEKYAVDSEWEEGDFLLGVLKWEESEIPVFFSFTGPVYKGYLAEAYYDTEFKNFDGYTDMIIGGRYSINFGKNEFTVEVDGDHHGMKYNALSEYLQKQNIEEVTFVKNTEKNEDRFDGTITKEAVTSLYERYEKVFGVNVLTDLYNSDKKRLEIVVQNNKDYDIEEFYLNIGIIGKSEYDLINEWAYEDVLPYEQGYMVNYYGNKKIPAKSKKKIIIPNIEDNEIVDIKSIVRFYNYDDEYYINQSMSYFICLVEKEVERYFKELTLVE